MSDTIVNLTCACCGRETKGRQFHNRDTGYGLCESCYDYIAKKDGVAYVQYNYGIQGVHIEPLKKIWKEKVSEDKP